MITLTPADLAMAAALLAAMAALTHALRIGIARTLTIAALRTALQLLLVAMVLRVLFGNAHLLWVTLLATAMLLAAGREVMARQQRRLAGWWGYGVGTVSLFVSSFSTAVLALVLIIGETPWYAPQYAIPLLGMLLGNTMNGVALGLDRLTQAACEQQKVIEARLIAGQNWDQAIADVRRESMRSGMIPIVNAMAAAGIVSLPGMMTGQIMAGVAPLEAVKYQILIMFLIAAGTVGGTVGAVSLCARRLFDARERLRLDRLS